ncbi:BTAD domain-containing putative transcriptional regulator [Micromonospora sp. URMC 105]|uniref:BTAD domain-containing putative transcriptional regulator n=1 Tax=Micromonospora sp. URMC 105 TaxID=3423413 RepID=UPI003F53149B
MEAFRDGRSVGLGGIKQRATLGFLLLQPNRVVPTSQLLKALWAWEEAPASARKILQNAVWGLRGILSPEGGSEEQAALLTQAPGYMLRVDAERIDVHRFHQLSAKGRAELSAGRPDVAAELLREALALWRGPALADLVEGGIVWSEVVALQNARLVALEEFFEAELACGRHHAVLGELETAVAGEPLRERFCSQLMLALYRCGRQADALNLYARTRTALVDGLGLEPGHNLRALQHAILTHDPMLTVVGSPGDSLTAAAGLDRPTRQASPPSDAQGDPGSADPTGEQDEVPQLMPPTRKRTSWGRVGRGPVSIVMARIRLAGEPATAEQARLDEALERATTILREVVGSFGGVVAASLGSVSLVLFDGSDGRRRTADDAVSAAMTIRERLGTGVGQGVGAVAGHLAVVTGEALVRYPGESGAAPTVNGALVDECHRMLSHVPDGSIHVCDETRRLTEDVVAYTAVHGGGVGWRVEGIHQKHIGYHTAPIVDREWELDLLRGLLERVRHRSVPHLVTVLGEPGSGKSRFVMEFECRMAVSPQSVLFLSGAAPATADRREATDRLMAQIIAAQCEILADDCEGVAEAKLVDLIERLVEPQHAESVLAGIAPLLRPGRTGAVDRRSALDSWRRLLEAGASERPVVVVLDDVHRVDDDLLDFIEDLPRWASSAPLLVVATARPALLERRPAWGGGQRHAATITLDPLSELAINRLLDFLAVGAKVQGQPAGRFSTLLGALPDDRRVHPLSMRGIAARSLGLRGSNESVWTIEREQWHGVRAS